MHTITTSLCFLKAGAWLNCSAFLAQGLHLCGAKFVVAYMQVPAGPPYDQQGLWRPQLTKLKHCSSQSQVLGEESPLDEGEASNSTRQGLTMTLREVEIYIPNVEYRTCFYSSQESGETWWPSKCHEWTFGLKSGYQQVREVLKVHTCLPSAVGVSNISEI